jgi:hypothetical protein
MLTTRRSDGTVAHRLTRNPRAPVIRSGRYGVRPIYARLISRAFIGLVSSWMNRAAHFDRHREIFLERESDDRM